MRGGARVPLRRIPECFAQTPTATSATRELDWHASCCMPGTPPQVAWAEAIAAMARHEPDGPHAMQEAAKGNAMQEDTPAARLCVLHVSPDAPPLDVYVDEVPLFTHLPYGQLSGCVTVAADRHRLRAFVAGTTDWEYELLDAELEKLRDDEVYIVALVERAQNLQVALLEDTAAGAEPRRARVRVLHASPDAPALDVDVTGRRDLFRLVALTEITPYGEVDAGTYELIFRRANHPEVIARLPEYTLVSGGLHTFVVHGLVDGQPPLAIMPIVRTIERCVPER